MQPSVLSASNIASAGRYRIDGPYALPMSTPEQGLHILAATALDHARTK